MDNISRRSFLKSGAVAAAAAGVASVPASANAGEEVAASEDWLGTAPDLTVDDCVDIVETEVLVVGSALSGSMAAYGAVKNGAKVTVIERNASPHIGGMTISSYILSATSFWVWHPPLPTQWPRSLPSLANMG